LVREITAILVSWKDEEDLAAAVSSLARAREQAAGGGPPVSLVVVDNGGGILDRCRIQKHWPEASILVNETNRGFGPAANQAAEAAPGDILLFLNPDTRAQGDPFPEIARAFDAHPAASAIAPRLLDFEDQSKIQNQKSKISPRPLAPPDREDQFTFQLRRLPTLANDARELLLVDHIAPDNRRRRRVRYADADREKTFAVEQAAAAALAVRKDLFTRLGGFDQRFVPAWFEDVDLCARLGREGPILYWPVARFRHRGGGASQSLGYARFLPIYYRNAILYRRIHYSLAARIAYRPLLAAGMLLRLLALPFRKTVPRPRGESARAYVSTFLSALGLGPRQSPITHA
jgi:N-acetylglucosaminyl-diphospho-decaprenol L-rhamnosyltransferase